MEAAVKDATRGFTRRAVEELSSLRGEPDWVREKRLAAWEAYEAIPMPTRTDEEWRRTDIRRLPIGDVAPYATPNGRVDSVTALQPEVAAVLGDEERRAGLTVQVDSSSVFSELSADLAEQGVVFCDLATAIEKYPDLVKQHFMTEAVPVDDNKFAALHGAFWSGGTFVYVPAGVQV